MPKSQQLSSQDLRFGSLGQFCKKLNHRKSVVLCPDFQVAIHCRSCYQLCPLDGSPSPSGLYPLSFTLYPFKFGPFQPFKTFNRFTPFNTFQGKSRGGNSTFREFSKRRNEQFTSLNRATTQFGAGPLCPRVLRVTTGRGGSSE